MLSVLNDANLEDAVIAARPKLVDSWLKNELSSAKIEDFELYREKLSSVKQIEKISHGVCNEWKGGKRKTSAEIANKITVRGI